MFPGDIQVNDLVEFKSGEFGRIVKDKRPLPIGMFWAVVTGKSKAKEHLPVYINTIIRIKRNGSNWFLIKHSKLGGLSWTCEARPEN